MNKDQGEALRRMITANMPTPKEIGITDFSKEKWNMACMLGRRVEAGHEINGAQWNGQLCKARAVTVEVKDDSGFPQYWAKDLIGQKRKAIEVTPKDGDPFLIDNEDGTGYAKVTVGCGMWIFGHRGLSTSVIIEP